MEDRADATPRSAPCNGDTAPPAVSPPPRAATGIPTSDHGVSPPAGIQRQLRQRPPPLKRGQPTAGFPALRRHPGRLLALTAAALSINFLLLGVLIETHGPAGVPFVEKFAHLLDPYVWQWRLLFTDTEKPPRDDQIGVSEVSGRMQPPPPPSTSVTSNRSNSRTEGTTTTTMYHCYTLEAYSQHFIGTEKQNRRGDWFFRCGTRVTDLRTESRKVIQDSCGQQQPKGSGTSALEPVSSSSSAHLRIVLTDKEVFWHTQLQQSGVAASIPLSRFNDDYCDCLDGTDELLTNACSMSGAGMALAGARWPQFIATHRHLPIYEDADEERLNPFSLGGPVLPVQCAGDSTVWLAPSVVGDGIVDCCDGSDEVDADALAAASARRASLGAALTRGAWGTASRRTSPYADRLHPHYTSAAAVLVDKGYDGLFSCAALQQHRRDAATLLLARVATGHRIQQARALHGWDVMGKGLVESLSTLTQQLARATDALARMEDKNAGDPTTAGANPFLLQALERQRYEVDLISYQRAMNHFIATQYVFGTHYEYYPLRNKRLRIHASNVVRGDASSAPHVLEDRNRRRQSVADILHYSDSPLQQHPPHIDNFSNTMYGFIMADAALSLQSFDVDTEGELVARRLHLLQPEEPYSPRVFSAETDVFDRSPILLLGQWRPSLVANTTAGMALTDPAGDVDLSRRAMVQPFSRLSRGGGRLQWPTRQREPKRVLTFDKKTPSKTAVEVNRLKEATEEKEVMHVNLLHHTATPNLLPVHVFTGGMARCDLDPPANQPWNVGDDSRDSTPRLSEARVVFICDPQDSILSWAVNGKCENEIVVGTPSACSGWVLQEAQRAVARCTAAVTAAPGSNHSERRAETEAEGEQDL